jgi:hypothetical protein
VGHRIGLLEIKIRLSQSYSIGGTQQIVSMSPSFEIGFGSMSRATHQTNGMIAFLLVK